MEQQLLRQFSMDRFQQYAATCGARTVAITGGPGVGKTRTLVARVRHWLESDVFPEEILVVTPTRAQAQAFAELLEAAGVEHGTVTVSTPRQVVLEILRLGYSAASGSPTAFTVWERTRILRVLELYGNQLIGRPIHRNEGNDFFLITGLPDSGNQWTGAKSDWEGLLHAFTDLKEDQQVIESRHLVDIATVGLDLLKWGTFPPQTSPWGHLAIDHAEDLTSSEVSLLMALASQQPNLAVTVNLNEAVRGIHGPKNDAWEMIRIWAGDDLEECALPLNHRLTPPLVDLEKQVRANWVDAEVTSGTDSTSPRPRFSPARLYHVRGTKEKMDKIVLAHLRQFADDHVAWEELACLSYGPHTRERVRRLLVQEQIPHTVLGDGEDSTGDSLLDRVLPLVELVANPRDMGALQAWHDSLYREKGIQGNLAVTSRICKWLAEAQGGLADGIGREATRHRDGTPVKEVLALSAAAYREVSAIAREGNHSVEAVWRKAFETMAHGSDIGVSIYLELISSYVNRAGRDQVSLLHSVEEMRQAHWWRWTNRRGISLATFHASKGLQWNRVWLLDVGAEDMPQDTSEGLQHMTAAVAKAVYVGLTRARLNLFLYYSYTAVNDSASWPFNRRSTLDRDQHLSEYIPKGDFLDEVWMNSEGRIEDSPGQG